MFLATQTTTESPIPRIRARREARSAKRLVENRRRYAPAARLREINEEVYRAAATWRTFSGKRSARVAMTGGRAEGGKKRGE